ncbi:hypothetical protein niasHT_020477 [Heterodera trifolii]|uniref:C-type lectin domain-containing protein n=1 Tax=Heterodera trifolii TaxID=157864 RepID=A0ABD2JGE7_9BILA
MQPQIIFSILILLLTIEVSSFQLFLSFLPSAEGENSVKNNEKIYGEEEHSQKKREAAMFSIKGQSKTLKKAGENLKTKRRGLVEGKKIVLRVSRKSSKAKKEYDSDGSSSSSKDSSSKDSSSSKGSSSHKDSSSGHSSESKESHSSKDSPLKPCSPNEDSSSANEKPSNSKSSDTVSTSEASLLVTEDSSNSEASSSDNEESSTSEASLLVTEDSSNSEASSSDNEESSTSEASLLVTEDSSNSEVSPSDNEESSTSEASSSDSKESSTSEASSSDTSTSEASSSDNEESSTISESCASLCSGFGWTNYNGNCYKVVEGLMNQTQAVAACTAEDPQAQLVSIWDEAENRLIAQIITRPLARSLQTYNLASPIFNTFWIGLRRVLVGNRYQSTWTNGSAAIFGNVPEITTAASRNTSPWAAGQPSGTNKYTDPTGAKEECVHMLNAEGRWNDARCQLQMTGAICKKSAQSVGSSGTVGSTNAVVFPSSAFDLCNPSVSPCNGFGWTISSGKCYKVIEGLMNGTQAVSACTAEDPQAQLVSIWDEAENRLIAQIITRPLARSLQTYNLASPIFNTFWIGLRRVLVGNRYQSTWTNGSAAIFGNVPEITTAASRNTSPWAAGQPSGTNKYTDPTGAKEECVHMLNAEGRWNDARCQLQMTGAICKKTIQF